MYQEVNGWGTDASARQYSQPVNDWQCLFCPLPTQYLARSALAKLSRPVCAGQKWPSLLGTSAQVPPWVSADQLQRK